MRKFWKRTSHKVGLPPGTLVHIGEKKIAEVQLSLIDYTEHRYEEKEVTSVEEFSRYLNTDSVTWFNVVGIHDIELIDIFGTVFGLHSLLLEDIVNTDQRVKLEDFEKYLAVILKMLLYDNSRQEIHAEQVSLVLGPSFVISFQESAGDVFNPVRERIRNARGRIRKMGSNYLAYALTVGFR